MNNQKIKLLIIVLVIIITALTGYIIYDKIKEKDLSDIKNNINNQTNYNDNELDDSNNENIKGDNNESDKCDKNYSMMYNDKYIYKIKVTNKNGAMIYNNYVKAEQNVTGTIELGKEIGVVADKVDIITFYEDNQKNTDNGYRNFDEIKNYYYFAIDVCGAPQYIKYTDVEVIEDSIVLNKDDKTQKYYITDDEYLYDGPGLSFEKKDNTVKISKGTILDVNVYSRIGNAFWLYLNYKGNSGWILAKKFNSVNYPYDSYKYGTAVLLDETKGEINLGNEENLYEYAFSTKEPILKIPKDTKISYDYSTKEPGISYYHVNYKGNSGWIVINDAQ